MATLPAIEVTCSFTVVEWAPLNPFSWVWLKAIETFPVGHRPTSEQLAGKLCVGDATFLDEGWSECIDARLVSSGDGGIQSATLTAEGRSAVTKGYVALASPFRREGEVVYFMLYDGKAVRWQNHFRVNVDSAAQKPKWADSLTPERLAEAIASQNEDSARHIGERQRIDYLEIDWSAAQRVSISTDRL